MDPPEHQRAVPSRVERRHHKKGHTRTNNLTLSLSPRPPRGNMASPPKPLASRSAPAHGVTSPEMPASKAASVTISGAAMSPDSMDPLDAGQHLTPRSSGDPLGPAPAPAAPAAPAPAPAPAPAAAAAAAAKRPDKTGPPPLTPFPPWVGGSDSGSEEEEEEEEEGGVWPEAGGRVKRRSVEEEQRAMMVVEGRWLFGSVMHGVVLALQSVVALAVFSAVAWVTIWHKSDSDAEFWQWLWIYAEPCVGMILILCCGTLIAHEVRILSAVALLYLQSAILIVTTATSLILWLRCFQEDSRAVKGVLMGCNVFIWGLAFFGFMRAVVLWMVEVEDDDDDDADAERAGSVLVGRGRGVWYGTFLPEGGGGGRRRSERIGG